MEPLSPPQWDGSGHTHLFIGSQEADAYLVDEVLVLSRPLSQEEVEWMYKKGIEEAGTGSDTENEPCSNTETTP